MMYMIYGVTDCPHCLRAQALCMEKDVDYAWVMMDWSKDYREHIKSDWKQRCFQPKNSILTMWKDLKPATL
jgi:glutaredoxin